MGLLDRKGLLKKEPFKIEKVELSADSYVFVRQMSGRERDHFEQSLLKAKKGKNGATESYEQSLEDFRAKLAVCTVCDEEGTIILQKDDYEMLSLNMSATTLEKIITTAQKINSITEQDKDALVKNSEAGVADNSTSGSVKN